MKDLTPAEILNILNATMQISKVFADGLRKVAKKKCLQVNMNILNIELNIQENIKEINNIGKALITGEKIPAEKPSRREKHLISEYGINEQDFKALLESQNGVCAICGEPPTATNLQNQNLVVDHDHETGKVRGLLCGKHNTAIGLLSDSPQIVVKALGYLMNQSKEKVLDLSNNSDCMELNLKIEAKKCLTVIENSGEKRIQKQEKNTQ